MKYSEENKEEKIQKNCKKNLLVATATARAYTILCWSLCEIANMISSYRDIRLLHNIQFFFEIVMKYLNF